jgi:hypothetical protein
MNRAVRVLAIALGALAIAWLLTRLPADVFAATQATLFVAASVLLLLVAAAVILRPARKLERALFALPLAADGPLLGLPRESEMRTVFRPLLVAGVCAGVAALAGLARG